MLAVFRSTRKFTRRAFGLLAFLALAACDPIDFGGLTQPSGGGPTIDPNAPVPVALLLPRGSGNPGEALLADSLENAARLAVADMRGAQIDLRIYSTAGNAQTAAAEAVRAVNDGAKIIVGPLYAESANAVAVAVASRDVNVLAFSNNPTIAGGNLFVLGPTFENTARRLMGYARAQGRSRAVVVHATDVSGQLGRNAIQKAAAQNGMQVVDSVDYPLSQEGVASAIPRVKAAVDNGGADIVFLTSTPAGALPLYASMLPSAGVRPETVQYMGLTRWDIPAQMLQQPGLQGGLFARPDPGRTAQFQSRYQAATGDAPHPLAFVAFDGIAAIGALVANGNRNALSRGALTQSSGFQGATGVFRLRNDGTNDRALSVATIRNNNVVIVDQAPSSFAGF